ncbi:MAG: ATP-binding protein [Paraprevotella sp.]|nr:ATP-binding protein [Paraprevotella sp.]
MKELLKRIIFEQQDYVSRMIENTIPRFIADEWLDTSEVLIISGIRRCGKSVLMQQIRRKLPEKDFFFNFDDDRLVNFKIEDFQTLQECFYELFGKQRTYYFDEIQNIRGWETFVRRLYNEECKVIVTGSNAKMLSRELGTHLTGRYISVEMYPFSFREFLMLNNHSYSERDFYTTAGRATLLSLFRQYLSQGGFPRFLVSHSVDYLKSLYQGIIYRDVLTRNAISNEKEMQEMIFYLASNATKRITYSSLGKIIGVKHPETVKKYLDYVEQTYLIHQLLKYDPSLKIQLSNPKKIYFIDNAIVNRIGFNATANIGVQLENLVFIELRRRGCQLFYHSDNKECDFIVRNGTHITQVYQVTVSLSLSPQTREREIAGLMEAMISYQLNEGYIITMEEKEELNLQGHDIHIIPAWEWMLK